MKCTEFLKELNEYLDDALDPRTRSELDDHLAWCHNCYVVCDTTKKTIQIYKNTEVYDLPDELRTRLQQAIQTKCQAKKKASGPQNV